MSIKLYDFHAAPSPRRTRIFLAEKGVDYEKQQIDLGTQEQLGDGFKKINPNCTVPALVTEEGNVLTQNTAIACYLEARFPGPPLIGTTPDEVGQVLNWNARVEWEGLQAVAEVLRNSSPRMKDRAMVGPQNHAQIPELAQRGAARLPAFFEVLDQALADREFLATDFYSLADITALVVVDFARWVKVVPQERHVHLKRWHEQVSARPSAQA